MGLENIRIQLKWHTNKDSANTKHQVMQTNAYIRVLCVFDG